jgi:hypothetical protein
MHANDFLRRTRFTAQLRFIHDRGATGNNSNITAYGAENSDAAGATGSNSNSATDGEGYTGGADGAAITTATTRHPAQNTRAVRTARPKTSAAALHQPPLQSALH